MGVIRWSVLVSIPLLLAPVWRAARHFRLYGLEDVGLEKRDLHTATGKRYRHYYAGTAFLGVLFEMMHGRKRSGEEHRCFSLMAALAAHFDDLSDLPGGRNNHLLDVGDFEHPDDPGQRARTLLHMVNRGLPAANAALFHDCLNRVYRIESESRQTGDSVLMPEVLADLTAEKGACSVLLFRCLLDWPLEETEKNALRAFGSLIQYCDDAFDVWFDLQSRTQTPATFWLSKNDPEALSKDFEKQVKSTQYAFKNLPFSSFRKSMAWNTAASIAAIGRVCALRYMDLKKKHGTLPLDNRKLMVVDMGLFANQYQAAINWLP